MRRRKKIIVAVSGGFDPLHLGHLNLLKSAKELGDELVVILNNDHWLRAKKGYVFLPQKERKTILEAIRYIDKVILTSHPAKPKDMSVSKELLKLKPDIFANGGDRTKKNIPEVEVCQKIGCQMVFGVGGRKIQSSSWLIKKAIKKLNKNQN